MLNKMISSTVLHLFSLLFVSSSIRLLFVGGVPKYLAV